MSLKNFLPISREVMQHWVYKDNDYFKVWVEMLFRARFSESPKKDIYEGGLYTINQGEFLFSRPKWQTRLNIKDHKLKKLIKLLVEEDMISKVGRVGKSGATIYLIKNYSKYNNSASQTPALVVDITSIEGDTGQPKASQTPAKHQPNTSQAPLKKNVKNEKKEEYSSQPKWADEDIEFKLSLYLYNHMLKNDPEAKKPNLQAWANHVDKMIRIDKGEPEQIKTVIEWCQKDSFWCANILSTEKLRKQYARLKIKMIKPNQCDNKGKGNIIGASCDTGKITRKPKIF